MTYQADPSTSRSYERMPNILSPYAGVKVKAVIEPDTVPPQYTSGPGYVVADGYIGPGTDANGSSVSDDEAAGVIVNTVGI